MNEANLSVKPLSVMIVCGEPSGDQLGAELISALKVLSPDVIVSGVGGEAMAAQGLKSLFPLDDTAVMGLAEVVPRIPAILRRISEAADFALSTWPDAVVLIDSPDFTHRIARRLKRIAPTIRTVNYVAPQVWASRSYRARAMARYFDLVLALLPFEAPFFESYGLHTVFVGHPVVERAARMAGGDALRARLGIGGNVPLLAVLPGSRTNEVRLLLPVFRNTVAMLAKEIPGLVCVLPAVAHVVDRIRNGTENWPVPLHILEGDTDKFAAFDAADAALAASGTVTTELALSRTPFVMAYKLGWLTYKLMRPFIHAPYATLVNIILGREAVPEFVQEKCTAAALSGALVPLFQDEQLRERQLRDLYDAVQELGVGGESPSLRAARALLAFARASHAKAEA